MGTNRGRVKMIIRGNFSAIGLVNNRFLHKYLQKMYQQGQLCDAGIAVFMKMFETFQWRIINEQTIKKVILQTTGIETHVLKEKNSKALLIDYNKDVFKAMMRFSLWSRSYKKSIKDCAQLQKIYAIVVAIVIADMHEKCSIKQ